MVAYDARGHGRSGYSTVPSDYDKRAPANELRLVLDVLGLTRGSLCGTSMDATSALLSHRPIRSASNVWSWVASAVRRRHDSCPLILTQSADALHPLRSGQILYDLLPDATLCVAPTATFWDGHLGKTADLIAAFVSGRDVLSMQVAEGTCTVKAKKRRG